MSRTHEDRGQGERILIVTPAAARGVTLDEHGRTVLADDSAEIDVLGVDVVNR